jgi:di/tricarboxylate transporter
MQSRWVGVGEAVCVTVFVVACVILLIGVATYLLLFHGEAALERVGLVTAGWGAVHESAIETAALVLDVPVVVALSAIVFRRARAAARRINSGRYE